MNQILVRSCRAFSLALVSIAVWSAAQAAPIVLGGAAFNVTDAFGVGYGFQYGENSTGTATGLVWVGYAATGGPSTSPNYLNTVSTPNLGYTLQNGENKFTVYMMGSQTGYRSATLFFDGSTAPQISAYALTNGSGFAATGGTGLMALDALGTVTGSGSLSYDNGSVTATLTDLQVFSPGTFLGPSPGVGPQSASGFNFGFPTEAVTFTLTVTNDVEVPEPSTLLLFGSALIGMASLRRRRIG